MLENVRRYSHLVLQHSGDGTLVLGYLPSTFHSCILQPLNVHLPTVSTVSFFSRDVLSKSSSLFVCVLCVVQQQDRCVAAVVHSTPSSPCLPRILLLPLLPLIDSNIHCQNPPHPIMDLQWQKSTTKNQDQHTGQGIFHYNQEWIP